jgi:[CysO sulfur-carrier protein]-S-L-cysteine hydrolase
VSGPVTIQVYPFRWEAELAVARLAADGIRAAIRADDEGGLSPGFFTRFGVRVVVGEDDLEDAYESLGIERVSFRREIVQAMFAHAVWSSPDEACGLVAMDDDGDVKMVFCLTNVDASEHRFTIDPVEHYGCIRYAEANGWHIGGVFHSHTRSDAYPSDADIAGGGDPDWLQVIVGPVVGPSPTIRVFRFDGGHVSEVSVTVEP